MTLGLHDIVKRLKASLEIKEQFPMFLSRKLNLVYVVNPVPEMQDPEAFVQAAPVQNTWYTAFNKSGSIRIQDIAVAVLVANETLELRVTVDGQVFNAVALAAVAATTYCYDRYPYSDVLSLYGVALATNQYHSFLFEGREIKVEIRKTTAAGAGNIQVLVNYGMW